MTDHIRLVDDLTVYRLFTGVIGRPYLGFHGELLCVRGDVLSAVGFDRESIVEDFAFALELVREGTKVWQSQTRVSILSPHDVRSFLKQRARWYWGVNQYLPKAPLVSQCVVGLRMTTWSLAITSSWAFIPLWLSSYSLEIPLWIIVLTLIGSMIYILTIGIGAIRTGGVYGMSLLFLVPVYATLEHLVPFYALWTRQKDFTVIDK
jgi:cellulose synthase/poly-beta-1,6-N-acetylglucosamine synthase-like glycosyltransferase